MFRLFRKKTKPYKALLDNQYMFKLFTKRLAKIDQTATAIDRVEIYPVKKRIAGKMFHLVVIYEVYLKSIGTIKRQKIVCAAHSGQRRKKAYQIMEQVYKHVENKPSFKIPQPLWYSHDLQALFYKGIEGDNLLTKFKHQQNVDQSIVQLACLLAAFHQIEPPLNIGLKTLELNLKYLDPTNLLAKSRHTGYKNQVRRVFAKIKRRARGLRHLDLKLAHGDMHLENVIFNDAYQRTYLIDFSEVCLAPVAYDLGSFLQQLKFMARGLITPQEYQRLKKIFLDIYFGQTHYSQAEAQHILKAIILFEAWVALKSVVWYLGFKEDKTSRLKVLFPQIEHFLQEYDK